MNKRVIQISMDIIDDGKMLSEIAKILENSGVTVLGADVTASWSYDNYMKGCPNNE